MTLSEVLSYIGIVVLIGFDIYLFSKFRKK